MPSTGGAITELYSCRKQTIGELLCKREPPIEVPEWQRGFSWDSVEVECFWLDLLAFANRHEGASLDRQEYYFGPVVLALQPRLRILLDGQHRLALAVILLSVIRDFISRYNPDAAAALQDDYIKSVDSQTGEATYRLTLSRVDRDFFRSEVQDADRAARRQDEPQIESHQLIWKARNRLSDRFEKQWDFRGCGAQAYYWAQRILDVLINRLTVRVSASPWTPSMRLPTSRFPQGQPREPQTAASDESKRTVFTSDGSLSTTDDS